MTVTSLSASQIVSATEKWAKLSLPLIILHLLAASVNVCRKEASVFMFEKKVAEKLHKPRRRETVSEMLRNEVQFTSRLKHPSILRVVHPLEESK